ncbi:MAG: hypothetical protein JO097_19265 [Acidobacteriaceae bacterium]|nr:hypothetical protein [Acidobacteriaceae bacterium]
MPDNLFAASSNELKRSTKSIGDLAEAHALVALMRAGYHVSIPFGENNRYDLIVERDGVLSRVQVKAGRVRGGAVLFNCYSSHAHRGGSSCRSYTGEIDFFAVYCIDNEVVYLIPIEELAAKGGSLRVEPTKNNQTKRIRWAESYALS